MLFQRERFLSARFYERSAGRQGYANGYKPERIDTPAGTVTMQVSKTTDHGDTISSFSKSTIKALLERLD